MQENHDDADPQIRKLCDVTLDWDNPSRAMISVRTSIYKMAAARFCDVNRSSRTQITAPDVGRERWKET